MKIDNKKRLNVIQNNNEVVEGITCFSIQSKYGVDCQRTECKNWINHKDSNNCIVVTALDGPKTLQDIGKIFGLTRMRICQIEKNINKKMISNQ